MAEVEQTTKNKIIVFCDCGEVHTITRNDEGELVIETKYKKQEKKEPEGKENGKAKKSLSIFG